MTSIKQDQGGSVFGGILLVAGCCIGAGMLGMPVLSAQAGFKPSVLMFVLSWLLMACTGLLLLEVNLWFDKEVSIISMAARSLGKVGAWFSWGLFLFLFYSLMVAYISSSGTLSIMFLQELTGLSAAPWIGSLGFVLLFGYLLFVGTRAVDRFNRILMIGLVVSYVILVFLGSKHVDSALLEHQDWSAAPFVLPAMVIAYGFHNMVPSLTTYLKHDLKKLKVIFIVGSFIPLVVYFVWEWLILGIVPLNGAGGLGEAMDQGNIATMALRRVVGASWVVHVAEYFAFFAIVTSFLGVALSFVDFLADGLHIEKKPSGRAFLCALVLVPPFIFAMSYPGIFLIALSYAGGFGAIILFGILPALMVWNGRYRLGIQAKQILPGGKPMLVLIILLSLVVVALQARQEIVRLMG